jgi:hypothetical protein
VEPIARSGDSDPIPAAGDRRVVGADDMLTQIHARCIILDRNGKPVRTIEKCGRRGSENLEVPNGAYTIRVEADCQPDNELKVDVDGSTSTGDLLRLGMPKTERMYLKTEQTLEEFPEAMTNRANVGTGLPGGGEINKSQGAVASFPPNTVVDVVRRWTDHETHSKCSLGIVRIVDAGGPVPWLDERRNTNPRATDVTGRSFVVSLEDLTNKKIGLSAAEYLAQKSDAHRQQTAQARQDLAAVEADEIKSGRCEGSRAANMQNVAAGLGRLFSDGLSSGQDVFVILDKKIVVATKDGTPVNLDAKTGGDEHLYAIGFKPLRIDLKDSTGYPVRTASPYATVVQSASGGDVDSRNFRANASEQLSARIIGSGCALLLTVKKL